MNLVAWTLQNEHLVENSVRKNVFSQMSGVCRFVGYVCLVFVGGLVINCLALGALETGLQRDEFFMAIFGDPKVYTQMMVTW